MSYTMQGNLIPRYMVVSAAGLLLFTIVTAAITHATGQNVVTMPPSPVLASRELRFQDRADRGVDIRDATTGVLIEEIPPKTGGFLRGAMRGLLYDVRYAGHHTDRAPDYAFRLTRFVDGRLSLEDTVTHRRLELEAFGSTNEQVFAKLLDAKIVPTPEGTMTKSQPMIKASLP